MLQHIHEHSCPACHICHPMPPPASNTSKASLPEVGLRLQDGRQKQPPIAFPHLQSIGQQPETEPCKQIRCSSGSTASATRQHRGDRAQWAGIAAARRTSATVGGIGSGRKTATCKVPAAEECRELRTAEVQLLGDFFACTILTSSCENKKPWFYPA